MSSKFIPSTTIDTSKERDWPANLGMLDWDDTRIVFTKRSLIEFLKYTGTTVDTNFNNISKLPRYATFGKLSTSGSDDQSRGDSKTASSTDDFRSGRSHHDIFARDEDDALSTAPAKEDDAQNVTAKNTSDTASPTNDEIEHQGLDFGNNFRPTRGVAPISPVYPVFTTCVFRRVRENPGGKDSLANLWGSNEQAEFKPTRRVRERPGGHDSISGIF